MTIDSAQPKINGSVSYTGAKRLPSKYLKPAWVLMDIIEPLAYALVFGAIIGLVLFWLSTRV